MELYGERVRLRALEPEDMEMLRKIKDDPWSESLVGGWSLPVSRLQQLTWYENLNKEQHTIRFIIETENEVAVGSVMLINIDWKNRSAETGIIIVREYSSKGIGFDAAMTRTKFAFEELNLIRLESNILAHNVVSQRLALKVGYKLEGIRHKAVYKNGQYHDVFVYSILRDEYEDRQKELNYWNA